MESNWVNHWSESLHSKTYCLHRYFSCIYIFHSNGKHKTKTEKKKKTHAHTNHNKNGKYLGPVIFAWARQTSFSPNNTQNSNTLNIDRWRYEEIEAERDERIFHNITVTFIVCDVYLRINDYYIFYSCVFCYRKRFNTVRLDKSETMIASHGIIINIIINLKINYGWVAIATCHQQKLKMQ